jgi:hypothetical protein
MSRKFTSLGLGMVCLVVGVSVPLAGDRSNAELALGKTSSFALGGVGVAGTMSAGERALREVLKEPDAVPRLERLLPDASPAGQLYALLGLRDRDRATYQKALAKLRRNDAKVKTARGCMLGEEPFGDLVKEIEKGDYDSFLAREWPKGTE